MRKWLASKCVYKMPSCKMSEFGVRHRTLSTRYVEKKDLALHWMQAKHDPPTTTTTIVYYGARKTAAAANILRLQTPAHKFATRACISFRSIGCKSFFGFHFTPNNLCGLWQHDVDKNANVCWNRREGQIVLEAVNEWPFMKYPEKCYFLIHHFPFRKGPCNKVLTTLLWVTRRRGAFWCSFGNF